MWLKRLFTVPEGEKITEKVFCRILVSSICSILLCMSCLFGTTWAWFIVDIENQGNVIQIATVTVDSNILGDATQAKKDNGIYTLAPGTYKLAVSVSSTADPSDCDVYVLMTVQKEGSTQYYCLPFEAGESQTYWTLDETAEMEWTLDETAEVSFAPFWTLPEEKPLTVIAKAPVASSSVDDTDPGSEESTDLSNGENADPTSGENTDPGVTDNPDSNASDATESVAEGGTDLNGTDTTDQSPDPTQEPAAETPSSDTPDVPQDSTDVS